MRPIFDGRWMAILAFVAGAAAIAIATTMDPPMRVAAGLGVLAVIGVGMNARAEDDRQRTLLGRRAAGVRRRDPQPHRDDAGGEESLEEKTPYREGKRAPVDESDRRGWASRLESILYGFDARSPDLFFEIVVQP